MDLAATLESVKSLSPYVAVAVLIAAIVFRWFDYKEKKEEREAEDDLQEKVSETHTVVAEISATQKTMNAALTQHGNDASTRFTQEIDVLRQILRQMISLNASATGGISPDNAKLIVQYQWNWCRNETARVLLNSIRNNHFRKDEERVARSVYKAWHRIATDSMQSIIRLKGVSYPFDHLYTHHICIAWDAAWYWSIPVYYMSHENTEKFEEALTDLEGRIVTLFDSIFSTHIEIVEDVDIGLCYQDRSESVPTVPQDISRPVDMARRLAAYSGDRDEDSSVTRSLAPESLKQLLAAHIVEVKTTRRSSSGEIPGGTTRVRQPT